MTAFLVCLVAAVALGAGALVAYAVAALPLAVLQRGEDGGRYARLGAAPLPPRAIPPMRGLRVPARAAQQAA